MRYCSRVRWDGSILLCSHAWVPALDATLLLALPHRLASGSGAQWNHDILTYLPEARTSSAWLDRSGLPALAPDPLCAHWTNFSEEIARVTARPLVDVNVRKNNECQWMMWKREGFVWKGAALCELLPLFAMSVPKSVTHLWNSVWAKHLQCHACNVII